MFMLNVQHSPRFGNANLIPTETTHLATTFAHQIHKPADTFLHSAEKSLKDGADALERLAHQNVSTPHISHSTPSISMPISTPNQPGIIRQEAFTTLQPTTIHQDAFTTLQPKTTPIYNTVGVAPQPVMIQAPAISNPTIIPAPISVTEFQNQAINTAAAFNEKAPPPIILDRAHQIVNDIGIDPTHLTHNNHFEKMSSGAVFKQKTLPHILGAGGLLGTAGITTAAGLGLHSAITGTALTVGAISAGAAAGTGVGATVVGGALAGWLTYAGIRSKKVMNGYRRSLDNIVADLMKPGNENMIAWYLRTKSVSSAKTKARNENAKARAMLNALQKNPNAAAMPIFKIYMRHARNQNKVFLTRNPDYAARLLAEAQRVAAGRIDTQ
jgi:hypothetical protein